MIHHARCIAVVVTLASLAGACGSDQGGSASSASTSAATATTVAATTTATSAPTTVANTPTATEAPTMDPPFTVATNIITVVDPSRPTPATETDAELPDRTIDVWLYLPDRPDPAPLIMFSHGLGGHPDKFEELHQHWAEAGYAVAAPAFPLTNDKVSNSFGNASDGLNQPADVSFVLDHLFGESDNPSAELAGRFDADRIGAAGLSLGGATTYEVAINTLARDERFDAAIVMAGARFTNSEDGTFEAPLDVPVYILHGDADPLIPSTVAQTAFDSLNSPAYYLTLIGGGHAGPFEDEGGFEPKVPGMDELVHDSTIAFWDHHLLNIAAAAAQIEATATAEGLSLFQQR